MSHEAAIQRRTHLEGYHKRILQLRVLRAAGMR